MHCPYFDVIVRNVPTCCLTVVCSCLLQSYDIWYPDCRDKNFFGDDFVMIHCTLVSAAPKQSTSQFLINLPKYFPLSVPLGPLLIPFKFSK